MFNSPQVPEPKGIAIPRNPALLPSGLRSIFSPRRDPSRTTNFSSISPVAGGVKTPAKRALIGSFE